LPENHRLPTIFDGNKEAENLLILAHGAGAPMDTDFMNYFAKNLAGTNLRILRFEFPYMALRREGHGRRPPDRQKILLDSWRKVINEARNYHKGNIIIGGKSMGGRMASMIADECKVTGLVLLGYPFYAPGKADKPRIEHLVDLKTHCLVLQGERDPMGSREGVEKYNLSKAINIKWICDGNHDLKPRIKSGRSYVENLEECIELIKTFHECFLEI
jgi:predicted alpha/beta-hydrolase family hydrolase